MAYDPIRSISRYGSSFLPKINLPTIEPLPPEESQPEEGPLPPARRRRRRRAIVPSGADERASLLYDLSRRVVPSFDFFLFSALAGLVMAAGFVYESFPLVFLAALLAPFMAPVIGASLGTITGALRYWMQSLMSLLIGCVIIFLGGMAGGWAGSMIQPRADYSLAQLATSFTWPGFIVLSIGAALTTYLIVRSPQQKPLVSSVAIAYSLYLPIGAAGFGLTAGQPSFVTGGLELFALYLVWAMLFSAAIFVLLGLRPLNGAGYLLVSIYSVVGLLAILFSQAGVIDSIVQFVDQEVLAVTPTNLTLLQSASTIKPATKMPASSLTALYTNTTLPSETSIPTTDATPTPSFTPTRTLIPTRTPTLTVTPHPTSVWAMVSVKGDNGIIIRAEPRFGDDVAVVTSLINGLLVEILPDPPIDQGGGVVWVHVRTVDKKEGWVIRSLLITSTPTPTPFQ